MLGFEEPFLIHDLDERRSERGREWRDERLVDSRSRGVCGRLLWPGKPTSPSPSRSTPVVVSRALMRSSMLRMPAGLLD